MSVWSQTPNQTYEFVFFIYVRTSYFQNIESIAFRIFIIIFTILIQKFNSLVIMVH